MQPNKKRKTDSYRKNVLRLFVVFAALMTVISSIPADIGTNISGTTVVVEEGSPMDSTSVTELAKPIEVSKEFHSKIKVDGKLDDWSGTPSEIVGPREFDSNEYIWKCAANDEKHDYPDDLRWEKGSLDLLEFRVCEDYENINFLVKLGSIDNSMKYENGFSEQVVEILIDKDRGEGSGRIDTLANANLELDSFEDWEYAVIVTGKSGIGMDVFENSWDISVKGSASSNCIEFSVPKSKLGDVDLNEWSFTVLVGAYDDYDGFLEVPRIQAEVNEVCSLEYTDKNQTEDERREELTAKIVEDNATVLEGEEQKPPVNNPLSYDPNAEKPKISPPPKKIDPTNVYDRLAAKSVTGVKIVYDPKYKTKDYTCWTSGTPSYSKWNGTAYNDLNVVKNAGVVRRGTTFNVTGTGASASTIVTVKGPTDSGYRPTVSRYPAIGPYTNTWSAAWDGTYWNLTIPSDAPVGDYQIYLNESYCTVYVIFDVFKTKAPSGMTENQFSCWAYNESNDASEWSVTGYAGAEAMANIAPFGERVTELICSSMGSNVTTPYDACIRVYRVINARMSWQSGSIVDTETMLAANTGLTVSWSKKVALQTGAQLPNDMVYQNNCQNFGAHTTSLIRSMGIPARQFNSGDGSGAATDTDIWGWGDFDNTCQAWIEEPDMTMGSYYDDKTKRWIMIYSNDQLEGDGGLGTQNSNGEGSIDTLQDLYFHGRMLDIVPSTKAQDTCTWEWNGVGDPSAVGSWTVVDLGATGEIPGGVADPGAATHQDLPAIDLTVSDSGYFKGDLGCGDRDFFRVRVTGLSSVDIGFIEGAEYAQIYVNNTTTGTNEPDFAPNSNLKTAYLSTLVWGDDSCTVTIPSGVDYIYIMVDNAKEAKYADDYWQDGAGKRCAAFSCTAHSIHYHADRSTFRKSARFFHILLYFSCACMVLSGSRRCLEEVAGRDKEERPRGGGEMKYHILDVERKIKPGIFAKLRAEDGAVIGPLFVPKEIIGSAGISCELKNEKSCGAIIFREKGREKKYLLLHYKPKIKVKSGHWEFVKGHIESGEAEKETVLREIKEETGLEDKDIKFVDGFRVTNTYHHFLNGTLMHKEVAYYLVKTATEKIQLNSPVEHVDYTWLPYEEALEKLTYKNSKEVLRKAEEFLGASPADCAPAKKEWRF